MGLLVPHLFRAGDIPHLAALVAPRRLIIGDGVTPQGGRIVDAKLKDAFAYTSAVYKAVRSDRLSVMTDAPWEELIARL
jgi:hypothetical protein